jgi:hypothetical protein
MMSGDRPFLVIRSSVAALTRARIRFSFIHMMVGSGSATGKSMSSCLLNSAAISARARIFDGCSSKNSRGRSRSSTRDREPVTGLDLPERAPAMVSAPAARIAPIDPLTPVIRHLPLA